MDLFNLSASHNYEYVLYGFMCNAGGPLMNTLYLASSATLNTLVSNSLVYTQGSSIERTDSMLQNLQVMLQEAEATFLGIKDVLKFM